MITSSFKVIVVGMGVQGAKRAQVADNELFATVDIDKTKADYTSLEEIEDSLYNAVLLCTPDNIKFELLKSLLNKKKHILVEKPLYFNSLEQIIELEKIAKKNKVILYTAYNHRFEPHFMQMKSILKKNELGKIFRLRMFYGNGTSGLVKQSSWRDSGLGVILDIGSHLIDTLIYWFENKNIKIEEFNSFCFENLSPDHAILKGKIENIFIELEVSLLSWRNDFICDIVGDKASAHISSLCKWGPSKLIKRTRVLPSGRPDEKVMTLVQKDPTWKNEYLHFKELIKNKHETDLSADKNIFNILSKCML